VTATEWPRSRAVHPAAGSPRRTASRRGTASRRSHFQRVSPSVRLLPRLATLAGLATHLLDDVVAAGQRLLRFKDLGPRASRPPTCLGPRRGLSVQPEPRPSPRAECLLLRPRRGLLGAQDHCLVTWRPRRSGKPFQLPKVLLPARRKNLGTPPLDRSDQRSFRDHGGILSGNRIATVSARTPLASRP
jgi:hypothetical protein